MASISWTEHWRLAQALQASSQSRAFLLAATASRRPLWTISAARTPVSNAPLPKQNRQPVCARKAEGRRVFAQGSQHSGVAGAALDVGGGGLAVGVVRLARMSEARGEVVRPTRDRRQALD